jgi:uncharacterized membrane protein YfcA
MEWLDVVALGVAVYFTAVVSAVVGMAGGLTLLVIMLQWLDPLVALPLHGVVQLVSNGSRVGLQREHVEWRFVRWFALLLLPAGVLGLAAAEAIPRQGLRAALGSLVVLFVLDRARRALRSRPRSGTPAPPAAPSFDRPPLSKRAELTPALALAATSTLPGGPALAVAVRAPTRAAPAEPAAVVAPSQAGASNPARHRRRFVALGGAAGALNTSVGATGPLIAPFFLDLGLDRRGLIGTQAACGTCGHVAKIVVFAGAGFSFGPYLPALLVFTAMAAAGTWTGTRILDRVPERAFTILYLAVLLALGLRLVLG